MSISQCAISFRPQHKLHVRHRLGRVEHITVILYLQLTTTAQDLHEIVLVRLISVQVEFLQYETFELLGAVFVVDEHLFVHNGGGLFRVDDVHFDANLACCGWVGGGWKVGLHACARVCTVVVAWRRVDERFLGVCVVVVDDDGGLDVGRAAHGAVARVIVWVVEFEDVLGETRGCFVRGTV